MKVLLVGGSSIIRAALGLTLAQHAEVVTTGRCGQSDVVSDLTQWSQKPDVSGNFYVVIQVAADFGGATSEDYFCCEQVNAVRTLAVSRLAEQLRAIHFLYLASVSAAYKRGDLFYDIYALSKRHCEEVAQLFCAERSIPITILQPSQIYDAGQLCRKHPGLFYAMTDCAASGPDITIYGTRDARRNFMDDLVEACQHIVPAPQTGGYICAHPTPVRLSEMDQAAFAAFGQGGELRFPPDQPDIPDLPMIRGKQYIRISTAGRTRMYTKDIDGSNT